MELSNSVCPLRRRPKRLPPTAFLAAAGGGAPAVVVAAGEGFRLSRTCIRAVCMSRNMRWQQHMG